jgi:SAM-dependent methyltransferase
LGESSAAGDFLSIARPWDSAPRSGDERSPGGAGVVATLRAVFEKSAELYDLLYAWKDYAEEARRVDRWIQQTFPGAETLLDVACGTGKHLEHLSARYRVEGLDREPQLLVIARRRNPGAPLHRGDMVDFALGKTFDAVTCLFSSIAYVPDVDHLRRAVANMAAHVAPGGVLLVEPWFGPDEWQDGHIGALFVDEPELKATRLNVARSAHSRSILEFHYLVATAAGVEHFTEEHSLGLFERAEYLHAFEAAGLDAAYDPEGLEGRGLVLGRKPQQPVA